MGYSFTCDFRIVSASSMLCKCSNRAPSAPTPAPTHAQCWLTGQKVKIVPGSRYDGQANGSCATVVNETCLGSGYMSFTFENGYTNGYEHVDLMLCEAEATTS